MNSPVQKPELPLPALASLNQRSREIFRQIVDSFLTTGEPLGSRNLARLLPMPDPRPAHQRGTHAH